MFKDKAIIVMAGIFLCVVCVSVSAVFSVIRFIDYKKTVNGGITVTGSATKDFDSDLIVWRGSFSGTAFSTKEAYELLKKDADVIRKYLVDNSVLEDEIVFSAVNIAENYRYEYSDNGNIKNMYLEGYTLRQNVTIQSDNVDNIERISRDITQLIDSGVEFISEAPEYYYTKLDELKLEMIADATENARARAELVAENSKSGVGKLINANLGIFQITAQNSASDEYSSGGTFNTWSRAKTASVTVKLFYAVD